MSDDAPPLTTTATTIASEPDGQIFSRMGQSDDEHAADRTQVVALHAEEASQISVSKTLDAWQKQVPPMEDDAADDRDALPLPLTEHKDEDLDDLEEFDY